MKFSRFLIRALLVLIFASIPFGARVFVYQVQPAVSEYGSIFFYASDAFLLILFIVIFNNPEQRKLFSEKKRTGAILYSAVLLVLIAGLSVFLASSKPLALYAWVRLAFLIIFAFTAGKILSAKRLAPMAFAVIATLAFAESLLALAQFKVQGHLGLAILGEAPIGAFTTGTSKSFFGDGEVVRVYGTFQHPNVLAAFLLMGLCVLYYFWLRRPAIRKIFASVKNLFGELAIGIGIFTVATGLIFTFSRAAWLIACVLTIAVLVRSLASKEYFIQGVRLLVLLLALGSMLWVSWGSYVLPRVIASFDQPSVRERLAYNRLGWNLILAKPFGVGIGNQVSYAVQKGLYAEFGMAEKRLWQPTHNIYLLMASEIGIFGLLCFLAFVFWIMRRVWAGVFTLESLTAVVFLGSLLLLGLFDHFLWTLWQGQLMLWLAIGLAMAAANRPRS